MSVNDVTNVKLLVFLKQKHKDISLHAATFCNIAGYLNETIFILLLAFEPKNNKSVQKSYASAVSVCVFCKDGTS